MSVVEGSSPAGTTIFRAAAIERMSTPERLDMAAGIVRPAAWMILAAGLIVVATVVVASIMIDIPIKVEANGMLLNIAGVKEVVAPGSGQLKSVSSRVGARVRAGDVIAQVEQPDLKQEIDAATAEVADAREQQRKTKDLQDRTLASQEGLRAQQRQNFDASIASAEQRVGFLSERLQNFEDLATRGIITKQRLFDARAELSQATEQLSHDRNSLRQLDVDEGAQRTEQERERLGLELKLSSAERKLLSLNERLGRIDNITTPYNGVIAEVKFNEGEVVERGAAIVTIIPDDLSAGEEKAPLVATLYVQPADGKKIRPGMDVEILPSTSKREEHGFVVAKVTFVAEVPSTQEGMMRTLKNRQLVQTLANGGAPFEVRAELKADRHTPSGLKWSTSRGPDAVVSEGTPAKAEIITQSRPILEILIPASRQFFEAFRS